MHLLLLQMEVHLPMAHSLKEKRSILKKLLHEIRNDFNMSISEVDYHDVWQSALLAAVGVSGMRSSLERMERQLVERLDKDDYIELGAVQSEWL
jgi:uncharacterized protein